MQRRGYRKPVRTNKPGIADALRKGSIDDLMTKFNATIRTAKKGEADTTMLFEVTVGLNDLEEANMFHEFLHLLIDRRKDPFTFSADALVPQPESPALAEARAKAKLLFDELVPADDPPEATATGPTWAPHPGPTWPAKVTFADAPSLLPTEDDAVNAFKANVAKRTTDQWKALFATYFGAQRVKDIPAEMRAAFIAEASRDL